MASCCYHVPGAVYRVKKETFENYQEAIDYAKQEFSEVHQIRPNGKKYLFYSAPKEAQAIAKKKARMK